MTDVSDRRPPNAVENAAQVRVEDFQALVGGNNGSYGFGLERSRVVATLRKIATAIEQSDPYFQLTAVESKSTAAMEDFGAHELTLKYVRRANDV